MQCNGSRRSCCFDFFFQAEDGIRDRNVTGVQTCALPIYKEQFLRSLDKSLKGLSSDERRDIMHDFEEHFAFGIEEGKTEKEIATSLGSPDKIAKELLAAYHLEKVETTATTGNMIRAVWAVIGLGFFNLVIVLGPFIALA